LRSAFASTPTVLGLMKTVCGVTPRSVNETAFLPTSSVSAEVVVSLSRLSDQLDPERGGGNELTLLKHALA
jgi:hypothetical protein